MIDTSRNPIRIRVHPYATEYLEVETLAFSIVPGEVMSFGAADYNRDGVPDLYVVHHKNQTRLEVWSGAGGFTTKLVDVTTQMSGTAQAAKWRFSLADHDADGIPDLVVIRVDGVVRAACDRWRRRLQRCPVEPQHRRHGCTGGPLRHGRL